MRPNLAAHVQQKQTQQKQFHDQEAQSRTFHVDDQVFVRNMATKWLPGVIIEEKGDFTFFIELEDARVLHRHIDHIRKRSCDITTSPTSDDDDLLVPTAAQENVPEPSRRSTRNRNPPDRLMTTDDVQSQEGGV